MQRLELLNHNHDHKHWKLVEALRKKNVEEKALVEAQNAQKPEENSLNEVVSPVEAARRASEYIKKDRKANNDI
jgi:ATP phosphoribosyltransferase regulatory subunit HisZ